MNPINSVTMPSASHGLHKHTINVPRLFTTNFYEHIPTYSWKFRKGDKLDISYHFFNRLNPLPVPALVTGKTKICGYFVPMRSIFRGWFDFYNRTKHVFSDGTSALISKRRYFVSGKLSKAFTQDSNLMISVPSGSPYDIEFVDVNNTLSWYVFTDFGAVVYKVLRALGYKLSWYELDTFEFDALRFLAYVRIMLDHYFPRQYVGNSVYTRFLALCELDTSSMEVSSTDILDAIGHFVYGYYNDSIYYQGWDNPVAPNLQGSNGQVGNITINDQSQPNRASNTASQVMNFAPTADGTPAIVRGDGSSTVVNSLSQFLLNALSSVNNFVRRHNLGGSRWIEQYLLEHGFKPSESDFLTSYSLNDYSVPFEVSDVESNSDLALDGNGNLVNSALGDLAGKGRNSSQGVDIRFKDTFDTDGIFMIIEAPLPDNELVMAIDPTNCEVSALDTLHPSFDKLGVDAVPSRCLYQNNNGSNNMTVNSAPVYAFLDRYYQELSDAPLVYGDFDVIGRGSQQLAQYHLFRNLLTYLSNNSYVLHHSYDFLRVGNDVAQYGRIFYAQKTTDNIVCYHRIKGYRMTEKLKLGDSFDWDDDEFNKKVTVLSGIEKS